MAKRKRGGFDQIASAPWPVGLALGIVAYIAVRYGIGWYLSSSNNQFLVPIAKAASGGATTVLASALLAVCWIAALCSFIAGRHRTRLLEKQSGPESLRAMRWRQFEMLVGEAFRHRGYRIEETGLGGADGGIDLRLSKDGKTTLVQCKHWRTRRVGVKVVREMYGLLAHHDADAVKIVAVGRFTPDAERFARGKPIELITGDALNRMIQRARESPASPNTLPARPSAVNAVIPDCPRCGALMVRRTNRRSQEGFWGCPNFPACRGTRPA